MQLLAQKDAERTKFLTRSWGAQRSPTHSSPGSVNYQDLSSEDSSKSQLDIRASLGANVFSPFANVFGNTLNTLKSVASESTTNDVLTTGIGGSQSSMTWTFPHDLSESAAEPAVAAPKELGATQTITAPTLTQSQSSNADQGQPTSQPTAEPTPATNGGVQSPQGGGPPQTPGNYPGETTGVVMVTEWG